MRNPPKLISVVVPVYQEETGIGHFYQGLKAVLEKTGLPHEIVFVDDGSQDLTLPKLRELSRRDRSVSIISLSRNYGHQIALMAGIDHARADVLITMDSDLQHPPEYIPQMVERWQQGYDVVNMYRRLTAQSGWLKFICTKFFYWLYNRVSRFPVHPAGSDFRLIDKQVQAAVRGFRQKQFFLRGIISEVGFPTTHLEYDCPQRRFGQPSYSYRKLLDLALRGLLSYSTLGLETPLYLGAFMFTAAFGDVVYAVYRRMEGNPLPQGWLSTFSLITVSLGLVFLSLGIQGFYLSRIFLEIRTQPLYCVKELAGESEEGRRGL